MTSQPGYQMQYPYWPISKEIKGNQEMIFGQLIQDKIKNIFAKKSYTKCGGETIPKPFPKNQN